MVMLWLMDSVFLSYIKRNVKSVMEPCFPNYFIGKKKQQKNPQKMISVTATFTQFISKLISWLLFYNDFYFGGGGVLKSINKLINKPDNLRIAVLKDSGCFNWYKMTKTEIQGFVLAATIHVYYTGLTSTCALIKMF